MTDDINHFNSMCKRNKTKEVLQMINTGFDIHQTDSYGHYPLYYACLNNKKEIIRILMDHGADITNVNHNDMSYFSLACFSCASDVVSMLLEEYPVDVTKDKSTGDRHVPIYAASFAKNKKTISLLLTHGADINENNENCTALGIVCDSKQTDIAVFLIENGANIDIVSTHSKETLDRKSVV